MNKLISIAMTAGGLFALYEIWKNGALSSFLPGIPSNPSAPSPSNPSAPPPVVDIRSMMLSAAGPFLAAGGGFAKDNTGSAGSPLLPSYDWNYIYKSVRGRDPGSVAFPPGNIALDEWLPAATAAGFSGMGGLKSTKGLCCGKRGPRNNATPEPKNPCTPVPGMGRQFSGGF